jgi:hypothetical protein
MMMITRKKTLFDVLIEKHCSVMIEMKETSNLPNKYLVSIIIDDAHHHKYFNKQKDVGKYGNQGEIFEELVSTSFHFYFLRFDTFFF